MPPRMSDTMTPLVISRDEAASLEQSLGQWKTIIKEHPDYRDGYLMLAWISKRLGKTEEERTYLHKALSLDPNYQIPEVLQMDQ